MSPAPLPLSSAVVSVLGSLAGTDDAPPVALPPTTRDMLALGDDDNDLLRLVTRAADSIDRGLVGIDESLRANAQMEAHWCYSEFCRAVVFFFNIFDAISVRLRRMLFVSREVCMPLCRLADDVQKAINGSLRLVADMLEEPWRRVKTIMDKTLTRLKSCVEVLRKVMLGETKYTRDDFECVCRDYRHRLRLEMERLSDSFDRHWGNNCLVFSDETVAKNIMEMIEEHKPADNPLVEADPNGQVSEREMVLNIISLRQFITPEILDEYISYRAKWQLLGSRIKGLKIVIIIGKHTYDATNSVPDDPLYNMVSDHAMLSKVLIAAEKVCHKPSDVKKHVYNPLRESKAIDWHLMHEAPFINALIPHLLAFDSQPTVAQLQRAFRENK